MVSKSDLRVISIEESLFPGETRYKICVQGTNIIINVSAFSEEEALDKALKILENIKLDDDSLRIIREKIGSNTRC